MDESKKPWESKTIWAAILVAAAPLFPPIAQVVILNPTLCSALVGLLFTGLRLVTEKGVQVKK